MCDEDWVQIEACYKEEFVIVDDDGNEIPLENLFGGKDIGKLNAYKQKKTMTVRLYAREGMIDYAAWQIHY